MHEVILRRKEEEEDARTAVQTINFEKKRTVHFFVNLFVCRPDYDQVRIQ
jgi:hypothetical protein